MVRGRVAGLRHVLVGDALPYAGGDEPFDDAHVDPSDVALFLLSGGTTGLPKLIPRTHDDYARTTCASRARSAATTQTTRYLAALPIAHNFPLGSPGRWARSNAAARSC